MTRKRFLLNLYFVMILSIIIGLCFLTSNLSPMIKNSLSVVSFGCALLMVIFAIIEAGVEEDKRDTKESLRFLLFGNEPKEGEEMSANRKFKVIVIFVIFILVIIVPVVKNVNRAIEMYNQSQIYHYDFEKETFKKKGFYDKMWKTFSQKNNVANVNKETFLKVAEIVMSNRKDGQNLAWKWTHETYQVPFEEFTKFYADLSAFIVSQRDEYFQIEQNCMQIAYQNNVLIDTFPNNIYNRFIGCKKIVTDYSFTSSATEDVFAKQKEDIDNVKLK